MEDKYIPPYEITDEMLELVSEIMENLGKLSGVNELEKLPRLRRVSRIKSIHSSLAIENNTLSIEQVTDVINGKRVLAPQKDIEEVHNAFNAYEKLSEINPYSIDDLLKIHGIMMNGLVKEAGRLRSGQVGVYNQDGKVVHLAPPADFVPQQLGQLFDWVKNSNANMLIKSSVFHYEFEFIHPFNDGNGRTGRFWQTALLASWKPIFAWIPIESIIKDNQEDYYNAITLSTSQGKSNIFIEFMLDVINKAIKDIITDTRNHYNHINNQITELMKVIESYPQSATELMEKLNLKSRLGFRKNYLQPALDAGLIGMTEPDKPTSKNQRYFKI
ncbi:MAG: Fic family protein [Firmicutes bacterium]|nr:Fic family protein [Bacillota bacterium]MDY5586042.1 Fic family protein [Eubacteriales bacterium]